MRYCPASTRQYALIRDRCEIRATLLSFHAQHRPVRPEIDAFAPTLESERELIRSVQTGFRRHGRGSRDRLSNPLAASQLKKSSEGRDPMWEWVHSMTRLVSETGWLPFWGLFALLA